MPLLFLTSSRSSLCKILLSVTTHPHPICYFKTRSPCLSSLNRCAQGDLHISNNSNKNSATPTNNYMIKIDTQLWKLRQNRKALKCCWKAKSNGDTREFHNCGVTVLKAAFFHLLHCLLANRSPADSPMCITLGYIETAWPFCHPPPSSNSESSS